MDKYTTDRIRNVVLLGHGGCGKTSLVEAIARQIGITSRIGKVSDGNTISDYDKEEIKRKFSISTTMIPVEWDGYKINLLDTPGYFDFVGEVEEAVRAADAAIIVVSGKAGVEVGTEKAWDLCERYKLPRMVFVTEMDVDHASYREVVQTLTDMYGKKIAPFHQPMRENEDLVGYVNVVKMAGRRYQGETSVECDIPDYCQPNLDIYREALLEAVAETSEEYMEKYFSGEEFTLEEIEDAIQQNVLDGSMVPVTMGSGLEVKGIVNLLNDIVKYLPGPDKHECKGIDGRTGEEFSADYDPSKPMTAYVFKTIADPFIGKYSFVKVCSGVLKNNAVVYNSDKDTEERLNKLYILRGNKPIEVTELQAGDIGAIAKLSETATGDTLTAKGINVKFAPALISKPYTYKAISADNKGDVDKMSQALSRMMQEDQTIKLVNDPENRQTLLYGIGDQHLDVVISKMKEKYRVAASLSKPKVAFRETIRKKSDVESKYKKQSGGHGQYGHVKMTFEPSGDLETPFEFEQIVVGGAVPKQYFPAVEKGMQDSVQKGPLAGYPVVGVKAVLYDGSYHAVDSSEMAFKMATIQAFKKGFMEANPVLLEPIASLQVTVPDAYTGDVMGDLNKRRGRVLGMNPVEGGKQLIEAEVPTTELYGYSTDLRSMTGGRGVFEYQMARYEQAPSDVQEKEVEARKNDNE